LCDLGGPAMGYPGGLRDTSWDLLNKSLDDTLIELPEGDAANFVANSFYVETDSDRLLYSPAEISESARSLVEELGVDVVPVDISEFFKKGGGGPKCMVFNLGEVGQEEEGLSDAQREFRRSRDVEVLREQGHFEDI
ncbi:MAG: arginine deiminase-related protein, partial [Myxococcota bacterium]